MFLADVGVATEERRHAKRYNAGEFDETICLAALCLMKFPHVIPFSMTTGGPGRALLKLLMGRG